MVAIFVSSKEELEQKFSERRQELMEMYKNVDNHIKVNPYLYLPDYPQIEGLNTSRHVEFISGARPMFFHSVWRFLAYALALGPIYDAYFARMGVVTTYSIQKVIY